MATIFTESKNGYFGEEKGNKHAFGGQYIPEILLPALEELEIAYRDIFKSKTYRKELKFSLKNFVGRPTPLIYAENSSKILKNDILKMNFDCMIIDESQVMKNMTSQITNELLQMIDIIPHRFALSGTPTPNHNSEIFPQMKFVDPEVFGNNFYGFQARYFHQDMANPHRWYQTEEDKEAYFNRLREKSVFLKKEDCVDLPPKVFEVKRFELGKEQKKYYDDMIRDIQDNINEWSKFEFTAKLMKLREIVSGFVINKDGSIIDFDTNKDKL
ncbi:MAG TPA: hypothetical protein DEQ48_01510, partial [Helicobacter sp.]|nr:hypothetical protein [Helicobacter sp.]